LTDVEESPDALIGRRLGHYLVVEGIGGGAMGHVFRARDVVLRRTVALKVHRNRRGDQGLRRFLQESRAAQALQHPAIAEVYEGGQSGAYHFLAMELVEGQTLGELLGRGPLGWEAAIVIGREIASALGYAHRNGVVHRDLKPTNVIISRDGRVKLVDFGLAKQIALPEPGESESTIYEWSEVRTAAGAVLGTPAYMSPEQARAKPIDARADVFALGVVLSELIDGKPVFRRATPAATIGAILTQKPPRVDVATPSVPSWVADVVERCLEKSPDARFADGSELLFALESWATPTVDLARFAQPKSDGGVLSIRAPSLVPSARSISLAPPGSSARFVGRTREREALRTALLGGERLVTIAGPSGVGKTRLVRQHLVDWGAEEAVFIDLAGVRSEEDFLLACALGLRLREHDATPDRLLRRLVERRLKLVVLDGLDEALPFASPHIASWRERTTRTAFVLTSRAPVPIEGDFVITLEGLPVRDAAELFLERAMAGAADPVAILDHSVTAATIAEYLEGIPLAVELAAARAQTAGPDEVLEQIMHDLAWLEPDEGASERPGLSAVLDSSIRRLDPETRAALLSLSVLRTFDLAGVRALTGLAWANAETLIARLAVLSLVFPCPHPELLGEPRWAIREAVRRHAEETLAREGRRQVALGKAAQHLASSARAHREALRDAPARESFRFILADAPSYFALAETALREPAEHLDLAALEGLVAFVEVASREEAETSATPLLEPLLDRILAHPLRDAALVSDALVARGRMRLARGDAMAIADADRALMFAKQSGSESQESRARTLRARVMLGRPGLEAADEAERATDVARRSGQSPELALALEVLAEASLTASRLGRATEAAAEARALADERGDDRAATRLSMLSAEIARENGDDERARALLLDALDLTNATGQLEQTPLVLLGLGELDHRLGELERAADTYARALSLCPSDVVSIAHVRLGLALAQLETETGSPERAVAITHAVNDALSSTFASPELEALALATRAATLAAAGDLGGASEVLTRATLRARELDPTLRAAVSVWGMHLDLATQSAGSIERARDHLARASVRRPPAADARIAPGARHALAIAIRVLEAALPRRLSLIP
jgi:serine/threonine protein kinase/predicted ATPase